MRKQRVSLRLKVLPAAGIINPPACKGCGEGWVGGRQRGGVCEHAYQRDTESPLPNIAGGR